LQLFAQLADLLAELAEHAFLALGTLGHDLLHDRYDALGLVANRSRIVGLKRTDQFTDLRTHALVCGAIFANRLTSELKSVFPTGSTGSPPAHASTGSQVNPQAIAKLPSLLRLGYLHAFTNALSTVFLVASAFAVLAFTLSWFIRQLPLRETVASPDMADTFASPRGSDSLAVVIEQIGRLDRRKGAREIIRRVALRAGVDLDPAACWLLARLSGQTPQQISSLAERAHVETSTLTHARDRLLEFGLIAPDPSTTSTYELTAAGHSTLERLTSTGEERLRNLLECWRPDQHEDLARFIANLAHEFFIDDSALRGGIKAPATAVAS